MTDTAGIDSEVDTDRARRVSNLKEVLHALTGERIAQNFTLSDDVRDQFKLSGSRGLM